MNGLHNQHLVKVTSLCKECLLLLVQKLQFQSFSSHSTRLSVSATDTGEVGSM